MYLFYNDNDWNVVEGHGFIWDANLTFTLKVNLEIKFCHFKSIAL